jgi:rRNA biogenesis protein RRP5
VQVSRELVTAVVELVKDDYLVLSLPKHNQAVGFAAVTDFNLQNQEGRSPFKLGQQVQARIAALPSAETGTGTNACTHACTHARTHAQ